MAICIKMKTNSVMLLLFVQHALALLHMTSGQAEKAQVVLAAGPSPAAPGRVYDVGGEVASGFDLACPPEEFERYKTIVCSAAVQTCTTEWCQDYRHKWVKSFGACAANGCP